MHRTARAEHPGPREVPGGLLIRFVLGRRLPRRLLLAKCGAHRAPTNRFVSLRLVGVTPMAESPVAQPAPVSRVRAHDRRQPRGARLPQRRRGRRADRRGLAVRRQPLLRASPAEPGRGQRALPDGDGHRLRLPRQCQRPTPACLRGHDGGQPRRPRPLRHPAGAGRRPGDRRRARIEPDQGQATRGSIGSLPSGQPPWFLWRQLRNRPPSPGPLHARSRNDHGRMRPESGRVGHPTNALCPLCSSRRWTSSTSRTSTTRSGVRAS